MVFGGKNIPNIWRESTGCNKINPAIQTGISRKNHVKLVQCKVTDLCLASLS